MAQAAFIEYNPDVDCRLAISACFDAESGQPVDFGANCAYQITVTQGGVVSGSPAQRISRARARYSLDWSASITKAGGPAQFRLIIIAGSSVTTWNLTFKVEVIKL